MLPGKFWIDPSGTPAAIMRPADWLFTVMVVVNFATPFIYRTLPLLTPLRNVMVTIWCRIFWVSVQFSIAYKTLLEIYVTGIVSFTSPAKQILILLIILAANRPALHR
jgi:hypothetical protein